MTDKKEQKKKIASLSLAMTKKKWLKISMFLLVAVILAGGIFVSRNIAKAETVGELDSGTTSRIKTIYDHLKNDLSYGSDAAGSWGDWGAMWNRIRSAAEWIPDGSVAVTDVRSGKTFYDSNRTEQTGTYQAPGSCSTQQYYDGYGAPVTETTNCTNTITWTTADPAVAGDDSKAGRGNTDPRTGLIWSKYLKNNAGTVEFADSGGSDWSWNGTTDADSVAVGKTASQLCSERGNGWRLPTQKELMQAYIDGSNFNLSNPAGIFWSATENSSTNAYYTNLSNGNTNPNNKTASFYVRCVR